MFSDQKKTERRSSEIFVTFSTKKLHSLYLSTPTIVIFSSSFDGMGQESTLKLHNNLCFLTCLSGGASGGGWGSFGNGQNAIGIIINWICCYEHDYYNTVSKAVFITGRAFDQNSDDAVAVKYHLPIPACRCNEKFGLIRTRCEAS